MTTIGQETIAMRHAWESVPDLGAVWLEPRNESISKSDTDYFTKLLSSSDTRDLIAAAQWFASVGKRLDAEEKSAIAKLISPLLEKKQLHRQLRQSLASAAISVSSGDEAEALAIWDLTHQDPTILPTLEQWVAERRFPFAIALWKRRLSQTNVTELELSLALKGIESLKFSESADDIVKLILRESMTEPMLLQACTTLGAITAGGQVELASSLRQSNFPSRDLMAARLIANHSDDTASQLADELLTSSYAPAKHQAYQWHIQHAHNKAVELAMKLKDDPDAVVRRLAIEQLMKSNEERHIEALGRCLSDSNSSNRRLVRQALVEKFSHSSLVGLVESLLDAALQPTFGIGSDQAIEAVVTVGSQKFNLQLIDLLDHSLPEVRVRAAWAIATLGFADSQQVQFVFERCEKLSDEIAPPDGKTTVDKNAMLAYLLESLGKARHQPAKELLSRYITKAVMPALPRASGIWSLGLVLEGSKDQNISRLLESRMLDNGPGGEDIPIRYVSALAVGLIRAPESRGALRSINEAPPAPVGLAATWALRELEK